jgi:Cytochrome P460
MWGSWEAERLRTKQFMVKDAKKFAATGGWGYAQFDKDGNPADETKMQTCYPCHTPVKDQGGKLLT